MSAPHQQPLYGSDINGLIWAYHFKRGESAQLISANAARYFLQKENLGESEFIWLHFSLANSATANWLKQSIDLPASFYETLHGEAGSTRLEQELESLVAVIHDVLFDFNFDSSSISTGSVYVDANVLISARLRPLRSIEKLRCEVRDGDEFSSPIDLLAHLLQDQVSVLVAILRRNSARVDQIEDRLLANRVSFSRSELGSLRRVLVRLQRLLAPEPASFFRLLNRPPRWIGANDLLELQQSAEEFSLAVGDTQALIERVKLLQEELAAQVNEQTNRTLYVLTLVTVLALPINLVAALFGMNVGGIPLADSQVGFALVVFLVCGFSGLLAYLALNKRRE